MWIHTHILFLYSLLKGTLFTPGELNEHRTSSVKSIINLFNLSLLINEDLETEAQVRNEIILNQMLCLVVTLSTLRIVIYGRENQFKKVT